MSNTEPVLNPIIKEIIRTQVCFPDVQLLVDRVDVVRLPFHEDQAEQNHSPVAKEAILLYLTDNEVMIQAVIKKRLHVFINPENVCEGAYVILKDYKLSTAQRVNGDGNVLYFAISELLSNGHDGRSPISTPLIREQPTGRKRSITTLLGAEISPAKRPKIDQSNPNSPSLTTKSSSKRAVTGASALEHHARCHKSSNGGIAGRCYSFSSYAQKAVKSGSQLRPISRPIKLSPLVSLIGLNASRNKTTDVLALVTAVSSFTMQRKGLPQYRDIQITDASIDREVTLSIFIAPEDCVFNVGEIVLFRSVTTHEYKGGKLNAYPQHCAGRDWYLPWPYCITEIETDLQCLEDFKSSRMK